MGAVGRQGARGPVTPLYGMPCDVLNLEWSSGGRDRETASLICNALRRRGYTVIEESIFRYRAALARHRPRLLYMADPRGAAINYEAARFARARGFPIVTVTAEGNFRPERIREMFWGHVREGELVEDLNLQWSVRARDLALTVAPHAAPRLRVVGGVGFDRYRLYEFPSIREWMARRGLRFDRMVGYASWTFDRLARDDQAAKDFRSREGTVAVERLERDRDGVAETLTRLAEDDPGMLLLLKQHPGVVADGYTEIAALEGRDNVVIVRDEEPIADCIAACDVWMAFDSTTCLEAWLLGKQTLLINPTGADFPRDETHRGSPIFRGPGEVKAALASFYEGRGVSGFRDREDSRADVIARTIQWGDGRNHLRAVYYFEELLEASPSGGPNPSVLDRGAAVAQRVLSGVARIVPALPFLQRHAAAQARFRADELAEVTSRCLTALEHFDRDDQLTGAELRELEAINAGS